MQRIVILSSSEDKAYLNGLARLLSTPRTAVHVVDVSTMPTEAAKCLEAECGGKLPDLFIADLSDTTDCITLEIMRRLCYKVWGLQAPIPPTLGILSADHLNQPEWPAYIDDFVLYGQVNRELHCRVRQLLLHAQQKNIDETFGLADVRIEIETGRVRLAATGDPISLTPRESDLLSFLLRHRGKIFSRERLLDLVWGVRFEGGERTVDIHIRRLRSKLPAGASRLLETRRGVGYGFRLD